MSVFLTYLAEEKEQGKYAHKLGFDNRRLTNGSLYTISHIKFGSTCGVKSVFFGALRRKRRPNNIKNTTFRKTNHVEIRTRVYVL